jgi:hypothetical protein
LDNADALLTCAPFSSQPKVESWLLIRNCIYVAFQAVSQFG